MKIGFFGLLQIAFIVLKLTDYIAWSWALVFVPFYVWLILLSLYVGIEVLMDRYDPLWRLRK
jgi:hypothetical protein